MGAPRIEFQTTRNEALMDDIMPKTRVHAGNRVFRNPRGLGVPSTFGVAIGAAIAVAAPGCRSSIATGFANHMFRLSGSPALVFPGSDTQSKR